MGNIGISKAISVCLKNFTKVYPIMIETNRAVEYVEKDNPTTLNELSLNGQKWVFMIKAEHKGKSKVFKQIINKEDINKRVSERYINIAKQWILK